MNIGIQIGKYIIYPAMFLLLIMVFIIVTAAFIIALKTKAKNQVKKAYNISGWQKKELPETITYVREELGNKSAAEFCEKNQQILDDFQDYLSSNKVWDYNAVKSIDDTAPFVISKVLFYDVESSLTEYEDGDERALLLLNSIDLINGGPLYEGKECIWMRDDIEEYPDANTPAVQNRVKTVLQQGLVSIVNQVDETTGEINPAYILPEYIKGYTSENLYAVANDLAETPGFSEIKPESRKTIIDGLVFTLNRYFEFNDDSECVEEMQICYIRCLMCVLSMKMYDEIVPSLRDYRI